MRVLAEIALTIKVILTGIITIITINFNITIITIDHNIIQIRIIIKLMLTITIITIVQIKMLLTKDMYMQSLQTPGRPYTALDVVIIPTTCVSVRLIRMRCFVLFMVRRVLRLPNAPNVGRTNHQLQKTNRAELC